MRRLIYPFIMVPLIVLTAGCAATPPAFEHSGTAAPDAKAGDLEDLEAIFVDLHSRVIETIERLEGEGRGGDALVEIREVVRIAEETYLEDDTVTAIELLREAEELTRKIPR